MISIKPFSGNKELLILFCSKWRHHERSREGVINKTELKRFGADITVDGRIAVVNGVKNLYGANVYSTDLRGGASLVIAALAAEGVSTVGNVYHIDRGYEHIEKNLQKIGAVIKRKDYEEEKTKQSAEQ